MKQVIKDKFKKGSISKAEFIDAMYQQHQSLFEYSELLNEVDLSTIEILPGGVLFTSKQDGIKLFCSKNDKRTAPFEILNFNEYESDDAGLLYKVIANGDTIFDIGANIGWYSIGLAKRNPLSVVHSFEPLPATFSSLEKNVGLNNTANIVINNFGLSDENKTLRFYTSQHTSVSNSAENISGDDNATVTDCIVKTMDSYSFDNNIKVDVIKCDVEGAELFTFRGGLKTIAKYKPVIFTEMLRKWAAKFHYHPNDIIGLMEQLGYRCFINNGKDQLAEIDAVAESTLQTNFFFLHPEKHAGLLQQYEQR